MKLHEFKWLQKKIWCISNAEYQNEIWVNHSDPNIVDSFEDTMMYFLEDSEIVFRGREAGEVEMTDEQYASLKQLYEKVDQYDSTCSHPEDDEAIVNDPKWAEIREYAQKVYRILTSAEEDTPPTQ